MKMVAARSSETWISYRSNIWCYNREDLGINAVDLPEFIVQIFVCIIYSLRMKSTVCMFVWEVHLHKR
jgi:hypothetical protein